MKSYSMEDYKKAGCKEFENPSMIAVHAIVGGKVCDTGCYAYHSGRCGAYKNLVNDRVVPETPTETVREEAKRRGISISEVRRQRKAS